MSFGASQVIRQRDKLQHVLGANRRSAVLPLGKSRLRNSGASGDFGLAQPSFAQALDDGAGIAHLEIVCESALECKAFSHDSILHSEDMAPREFLKAVMAARGLTGNALALGLMKSGLTEANLQSQISRFVSGRAAEPRLDTRVPIAKFLGFAPEALVSESVATAEAARLGLTDGMTAAAESAESTPAVRLAPDEQALLAAYRDLPPKKAQALLDEAVREAEEYREFGRAYMQRHAVTTAPPTTESANVPIESKQEAPKQQPARERTAAEKEATRQALLDLERKSRRITQQQRRTK